MKNINSLLENNNFLNNQNYIISSYTKDNFVPALLIRDILFSFLDILKNLFLYLIMLLFVLFPLIIVYKAFSSISENYGNIYTLLKYFAILLIIYVVVKFTKSMNPKKIIMENNGKKIKKLIKKLFMRVNYKIFARNPKNSMIDRTYNTTMTGIINFIIYSFFVFIIILFYIKFIMPIVNWIVYGIMPIIYAVFDSKSFEDFFYKSQKSIFIIIFIVVFYFILKKIFYKLKNKISFKSSIIKIELFNKINSRAKFVYYLITNRLSYKKIFNGTYAIDNLLVIKKEKTKSLK